MALVPVPNSRLVLVDAPAPLFHVPRLLLVAAGIPLPAGVRAVAVVAAVNKRLGSAIAYGMEMAGSMCPALPTCALGLVLLHDADSSPRHLDVHAMRLLSRPS
jgi:hypothetical protein